MATATTLAQIQNSATPEPSVDAACYRRAQRRLAFKALLPALPLLLFVLCTFVFPVTALLWRSVGNSELQVAMPDLSQAMHSWQGPGLPDESMFAMLSRDLGQASEANTLAQAARRLNYYEPGFRSLLLKTARRLPDRPSSDWKATLVDIDKRWGDPETWRLIGRAAQSITPDYLLAAIDRQVDAQGHWVLAAPDQRVYQAALLRTFSISTTVTILCLLLGYPVAFLLATSPPKTARWLMILVIVPFWTSILVRTTAWYVLLQPGGVVNSVLISLHLITQPLTLVFNRIGVLIGMTHVLLPFMILAIYAVMKGISPVYQRAALSLGAHPAVAFLRIYLPQTLPGVGAGVFLVFIMALGYYITPALLGGGGDEMISQLIAIQMERQLNWGLAGALSLYLVAATLCFYFLFNRVVGVDRLKLG